MLYTYIYIYIYYIVASWCTLFEATPQTLTIAFPTRGKAHIVWDARSPRLVRSRILSMERKKKRKKKETRVRAHTNLQGKIYNLFFFLNFTRTCLHLMAIRDRIRKTFLFLRSRTKAMKPHVDESVLTRRSLFGLSKLGFHLFICRVRVFTFR